MPGQDARTGSASAGGCQDRQCVSRRCQASGPRHRVTLSFALRGAQMSQGSDLISRLYKLEIRSDPMDDDCGRLFDLAARRVG